MSIFLTLLRGKREEYAQAIAEIDRTIAEIERPQVKVKRKYHRRKIKARTSLRTKIKTVHKIKRKRKIKMLKWSAERRAKFDARRNRPIDAVAIGIGHGESNRLSMAEDT